MMSRAQTSCPSSAKQAAVTRPTQPTPMTPIGSFSGIEGEEATGGRLELPRGAGYGQHLPLRERLEQRVGDPVDGLARAPGHEAEPVAVVVELVLAAADLPDL